jgi:hypothetical protein
MKELTEKNIDKFSDFFYHMSDMMKSFSNLILEIPIYNEIVFNEIEISSIEFFGIKLKK